MSGNPKKDYAEREPKLLLSVEAAAGLADVSRRKMYELIDSGEVDSLKLGRARKVPRAAIVAMIERKVAESRAERAAS